MNQQERKMISAEKIEWNHRKIEKYYGIFAALMTICVLLLAMLYGQMLGGVYTFINGDLYTQCAPFAHILIDKVLNGGNLFYSFKLGLGMNASLILAFYDFSPFNCLYILSDGNNINLIAIAIFVLKAGCAAFSFWLYASYNLKIKNFISVIFSVGYALVSYGIVISNMTALYDGIYLLPMILVAIKYMVDNKKSAWIIILYFILFVSNFYSGYIVGLASFVYFIIYVLEYKEKTVIWDRFVRYILSVICSVSLSAFILVPALNEALKQGVVDDYFIFHIVPIWDIISYLFPFHNSVYYEMTPFYYCGLPAVLLVAAFFFNSAIRLKYKIFGGVAIILAFLTMELQPLYSAAHMFNNPTGYTFRYVYIISLVMATMGLLAFKHIDLINIKITLMIDTLLLLVHIGTPFVNRFLRLYDNSPSLIYYVITIILFVIWVLLFCVHKKNHNVIGSAKTKIQRTIFIIALCSMTVEFGLNTYILLTTSVRQYTAEYQYRVRQAGLLTSQMKDIDDSVYRVHYDGLVNQNQACLYDYYGVPLFASSGNQDLKNFLSTIGILCNDFEITDIGNTDLARLLLDEKYNLIAHVNLNEENTNYIEDNITVGFGFMVDNKVADLYCDGNIFENQNKIYSFLLGENVSPYRIYCGDVMIEGEYVNIQSAEDGLYFSLDESAAEGGVIIKIPADNDGEMYSWLFSGVNTGESPVIISPEVTEECGYIQHILNNPHINKMSKENGSYVIYIALADGIVSEGRIMDYCFATYDNSYISLLQDKLSKQSFHVETFEDGYVTGNITAIEPGICFMSIPYEDGWSAIVDGKAQEITPVFNEAFIGIPLDAGYHEIELRFEAPFSRLGCTLSVLGVIMLMAIGVIEVISCSKKSKI